MSHRKWIKGPNGPYWPVWPVMPVFLFPVQHSASPSGTVSYQVGMPQLLHDLQLHEDHLLPRLLLEVDDLDGDAVAALLVCGREDRPGRPGAHLAPSVVLLVRMLAGAQVWVEERILG